MKTNLLGTDEFPFHWWRQLPVVGSQAEVLHVCGAAFIKCTLTVLEAVVLGVVLVV